MGGAIGSRLSHESDLVYYNGRGEVTVVGVVADEPDVPERCVNLRVASRYLDLEDQLREVGGLVLVRTGRYPPYAYGDELRIEAKLETPPEFEDFSYRYYQSQYTKGLHADGPSRVGLYAD